MNSTSALHEVSALGGTSRLAKHWLGLEPMGSIELKINHDQLNELLHERNSELVLFWLMYREVRKVMESVDAFFHAFYHYRAICNAPAVTNLDVCMSLVSAFDSGVASISVIPGDADGALEVALSY